MLVMGNCYGGPSFLPPSEMYSGPSFLPPSEMYHDRQGQDLGYFEGYYSTLGLIVNHTKGVEKVFDLADFEYAEFTTSGWGASTDVVGGGFYKGFVIGWSNYLDGSIKNYEGPFYSLGIGVSVPAGSKLGIGGSGFRSEDGKMWGATQVASAGLQLPTPVGGSVMKTDYFMISNSRWTRPDRNKPPTVEDATTMQNIAKSTILDALFREVIVDDIAITQRIWR